MFWRFLLDPYPICVCFGFGVLFFLALITPAFLCSGSVLPNVLDILRPRIGLQSILYEYVFVSYVSHALNTGVWARSSTLAPRGGVHATFEHVYRCDQVS